MALAVVFAILSTLIAGRMSEAHLEGGLNLAAQRLAAGDLAMALASLPSTNKAQLIALYGEAFAGLLLLLAAITLMTALVVFFSLGRGAEVVAIEEGGAGAAGGLPGEEPKLCTEAPYGQ